MPKTSSQKGTVVLGIIILVFAIMLAFLFFIIALGMVKGKFEAVCKWQVALDIILGGDKQKALDTLCKVVQGDQTTTTNRTNCTSSGAIDVPNDYMGWVKEASDIHLGGDQAELIALIQGESGWTISAAAGTTSALGLGQFVKDTASRLNEFVGGDDGHGTTWDTGCLADGCKNGEQDARLDPKRSIYATAHLLSDQIAIYHSFKEAYMQGYHTYSNDTEKAEAEKGWARISDYYASLTLGGQCSLEIAVIPKPSKAGVCKLEDGAIEGKYKDYFSKTEFNVYKNVADKYNLVPIDNSLVPYLGNNLYLNLIVYEQLQKASADLACQKCFKITTAYRSCQHQYGINSDYKAQPGNSDHNIGYAVDINGAKAGFECNNTPARCSVNLVKLMKQYGFEHINKCTTLSGDYYTGEDCVHFSASENDVN